jgi:hypothetical protein
MKVEGKRRKVSVLVIRDEHGKVIRVAKSEEEKRELRSEYDKYNKNKKTQDLPVSKTLRRKITSTVAILKEHGFTHSLILYRSGTEKKTGKPLYKRMEIFKKTRWTRPEVRAFWLVFRDSVPKDDIFICVLQGKKLSKVRLNSSKS